MLSGSSGLKKEPYLGSISCLIAFSMSLATLVSCSMAYIFTCFISSSSNVVVNFFFIVSQQSWLFILRKNMARLGIIRRL